MSDLPTPVPETIDPDLALDKLTPYGEDKWFLFPSEANLEYCDFLLEVIDQGDSHIEFKLYEVTSWIPVDHAPSDHEKYMDVIVKWDGCSHAHFGDGDGYIHLCGLESWIKHAKVCLRAIEFARSNISDWNADVVE